MGHIRENKDIQVFNFIVAKFRANFVRERNPSHAQARKVIVDEPVPQVFHRVSRCVRRAFLCGEDSYSGRSYEHRRGWVRERLRELSEHFAVDVYAYAVMCSHQHVVSRTDAEQKVELEAAREESVRDEWPTSIEKVRLGGVCRVEELVEGKREVRKGENLAWKMGEDDYLKSVEASGRCVRGDKKGALGAEALPVLEGMRVEVEEWDRVMSGYGRLYWRVAGSAASLAAAARAVSQQRFWGSGRRRAAEV